MLSGMFMDDLEPYLEGATRAQEWRALRQALLERLRRLKTARQDTGDDSERASLDHEIDKLTKQIETLQIEEVAAQFAEDSLRFTLGASRLDEEWPL
jgi:uncharacterized coiled-coil DUF342 family protein